MAATFFNNYQGNPGENLTASGAAGITTAGVTSIVALTLTVGVWSVSADVQGDNNVTQTGADYYLYVKGVNDATQGVGYLYTRSAAAEAHPVSFSARVVTIVAANADKTIELKGQSITANKGVYGYISAIRII